MRRLSTTCRKWRLRCRGARLDWRLQPSSAMAPIWEREVHFRLLVDLQREAAAHFLLESCHLGVMAYSPTGGRAWE